MDGLLFENSRRPDGMQRGDPFYRYRRPTHRANPKVVQIPVRFVGSEKEVDRSGSALRIQKFFRGFRVRKCVRRIREMEIEVEAIEKRIGDVDLKDWKERTRVSESLMSLLLKLDSITGMDSGVRVLRKAVIRKAIALQERVDELAAGGNSEAKSVVSAVEATQNTVCTETVCENAEKTQSCIDSSMEDAIHHDAHATESAEANDFQQEEETEVSNTDAAEKNENAGVPVCCKELSMEDTTEHDNRVTEPTELSEFHGEGKEEVEATDFAAEENENDEELECCNELSMEDAPELHGSMSESTEMNECHRERTVDTENQKEVSNSEWKEDQGTEELLERIAEENAKLIKMMERLCERNEAQERMLEALSKRVGTLEKVFVCDWVRRKKKKVASSCEN